MQTDANVVPLNRPAPEHTSHTQVGRLPVALIQVRDMLALQGRMEAKQLSLSLHTPQPMIDAMLERLEAMGKAVRIQEEAEGCLSGSCKSCPEGKACLREWWALR